MQEVLAKITGGSTEQKCQLAAEVYAQVEPGLGNLRRLVESADEELEIADFDQALDQFEAILAALEFLLHGLDKAEIKRIKENLERDYGESVEILRFYGLLNPDGRSYSGDYGEFTSRTFQLPSSEVILGRLTPQQMKLYKQMEKEGLRPKLQITPMAFNIRTLGKKIDARGAELGINTSDTYVWDEIKDGDLIYAPTSIKATLDGKEIKIGEGLSKSQWIDAHGGFLIDIVPMKQHLDADPAIQKNAEGETNYNAVQAEKYSTELKEKGLTPMSYESYIIAQMRALRSQSTLDKSCYTLLLDSSLKMSQYLAYGSWDSAYVYLYGYFTVAQDVTLRSRASVRVL